MSQVIRADVSQLGAYISRMNGILGRLFESQADVNRAYNRATEHWIDPIAQDTGDALEQAGRRTVQLYEFFIGLMDKLNRGYQVISESYLGQSWEGILTTHELKCLPEIRESAAALITEADTQAIKAFEQALEEYISTTLSCIIAANSALDEVGYWKDTYYYRTREQTESFSADMKKCTDYLSEQREWVIRKRQAIEEALGKLG